MFTLFIVCGRSKEKEEEIPERATWAKQTKTRAHRRQRMAQLWCGVHVVQPYACYFANVVSLSYFESRLRKFKEIVLRRTQSTQEQQHDGVCFFSLPFPLTNVLYKEKCKSLKVRLRYNKKGESCVVAVRVSTQQLHVL